MLNNKIITLHDHFGVIIYDNQKSIIISIDIYVTNNISYYLHIFNEHTKMIYCLVLILILFYVTYKT